MFGKKMVEGKARILSDEGVTSGSSSTDLRGNNWVHNKYIVEVHPAGGGSFRAEVRCRVLFAGSPNVGDLVNARYDVESRKVELLLDGDPRYDPKLRRAAKKARRDDLLHGGAAPGTVLDPDLQALMDADEAERRGMTSAPPSAPFAAPGAPFASPYGGEAAPEEVLDPELQELMELEAAEQRGMTSAPPSAPAAPSSASRMDRLQQLGDLRAQGLLSDAEFEQEKARILNEP